MHMCFSGCRTSSECSTKTGQDSGTHVFKKKPRSAGLCSTWEAGKDLVIKNGGTGAIGPRSHAHHPKTTPLVCAAAHALVRVFVGHWCAQNITVEKGAFSVKDVYGTDDGGEKYKSKYWVTYRRGVHHQYPRMSICSCWQSICTWPDASLPYVGTAKLNMTGVVCKTHRSIYGGAVNNGGASFWFPDVEKRCPWETPLA